MRIIDKVWYNVHPKSQGVDFVGQVDCKGSRTAYTEVVSRMVDLQLPLREQNHTVSPILKSLASIFEAHYGVLMRWIGYLGRQLPPTPNSSS